MATPTVKNIKKLLLSILLLVTLSDSPAADSWRRVAEGVDYVNLGTHDFSPWSNIHVFRIDLRYTKLSLATAKDLSVRYASVDRFAKYSQALLAINGGFFDNGYHPLGLRIRDRKQLSPLKLISWWGVFYIKNQQPHLAGPRQFNSDNAISFAIQSGPRLIINGQIPSLKPGRAERSALGISGKNQVIILATNHNPLTTTELAELMKSAPLNCSDALNLDGGSSSQLFTNMETLHLKVRGFSDVSDAITVLPLP